MRGKRKRHDITGTSYKWDVALRLPQIILE